MQILLDGGSFDSFIHPRIARHLNLPIEPTNNVQVMVGDGNAMKGEGKVRRITVQVQGHDVQFPAYVLPVAGSDIVLGASWLATLGPHVANYTIRESYIKFINRGSFITLRGTNQVHITPAEYHQLQRLVHTKAISECYMLQAEERELAEPGEDKSIPEELQPIIHKPD